MLQALVKCKFTSLAFLLLAVQTASSQSLLNNSTYVSRSSLSTSTLPSSSLFPESSTSSYIPSSSSSEQESSTSKSENILYATSSNTTTQASSTRLNSLSSSSSSRHISSVSSTSSSTSTSSSYSSTITSSPSSDSVAFALVTTVVQGKTVVSDRYTTITYSPTTTASSKKTHGLSKKSKNIIIGCVVGIGVPLIIACLAIFYMFFIRSKRTDFIDSNGNVVTAYRANKINRLWNYLSGKDMGDEEYDSNLPLGTATSSDEEFMADSNTGDVSRRPTEKLNGSTSPAAHSNDLMLDEERFYDEDGNELNARNY
ncbi:hypothetical protein KAFR_0A06550 [Kazachstania africana CBS 2517]|uniref:Mid2 domain-containing protein n=1 Tax=Kazachstania africana (strain ATCC 22294 / BCRC 22015 / CBS 2517 / CECT 1963 / NBRC 1671 / NRRL Y-8276) TaxID=1071382 RepID=H2ANZ0_KAZAF|nr:hypothetical protein KAFR_0A06550 [Kazachstania africana CBS 2517]CCF56090.1 hypothetical protein KAFR_0A06550 [Kazachstania africana CBS 2517]